MSSVIISGDTSGSITLSAPAVAGTNTITLPASTGTVALTTTGTTQEDVWRLNTTFATTGTNTDTILTSNLSRYTDTGQSSYIGSGMTQSSGVFTFPDTGMYIVNFYLGVYTGVSSSRYISNNIWFTTNNSTYVNASTLGNVYYQGSATYATVPNSLIFNVTSTSLCKVKFGLVSENALTGVNANSTYMQFIRIGNSV